MTATSLTLDNRLSIVSVQSRRRAERNATDLDQLRALSIQYMVNVAEEVHNPHEHLFQHQPLDNEEAGSKERNATTMHYQKFPWRHNQDDLATELDRAVRAIQQTRDVANQTILVHCQCGVARSATLIIAYIMKTMHMPMQDAYDFVKARAPAINPNLNLLSQLREYGQTIVKEDNRNRSIETSLLRAWKRKSKRSEEQSNKKTTLENEGWWHKKQPPPGFFVC
ncbi:Dual specificity protein phosphatase 10 [Apophysomyces sp. BC1034]|nr:Dual specificity protein phosphatase 10 [Apophysomyces sp. BC1021]KAG0184818.1 Dual specificity protein phosphatase 10 [Apophysomyces sp. BC1034]